MLPSALLSRMRAPLPIEHQECLFLRYAFLKQLPADVGSHLVHDKTADIAVLSQRADEIYRSSLSSNSSVNALDSVHAVSTPLSSRHGGLNLSFSFYKHIFSLRCSVTHGCWVNFNLFWFQNYSFTVWNVELFLDFPASSSFCSNPWSRFSSTS